MTSVALGRGDLALPVVLDTASVRRPARGDIIEPEPVEDGRGLDHVRGPQRVAAEIEDDVVALAVPRELEEPGALVRLRDEVLGQPDLAEAPGIVEVHGSEIPPFPRPPWRSRGPCRAPPSRPNSREVYHPAADRLTPAR